MQMLSGAMHAHLGQVISRSSSFTNSRYILQPRRQESLAALVKPPVVIFSYSPRPIHGGRTVVHVLRLLCVIWHE